MSLWCTLVGWWYEIRYGMNISGHDFVEQDDGSLRCSVCGRTST